MGATTRDPNVNILVETGTPPIFKDESSLVRRLERTIADAVRQTRAVVASKLTWEGRRYRETRR